MAIAVARPNGERSAPSADADVASFDEFWDSQAKDEFGDLGPAEAARRRGARRRRTPRAAAVATGGGQRRQRGALERVSQLRARFGADDPTRVSDDASAFQRTRLDSGLRVVTERLPALRSVAVGFWVATGSRDETDELAGASHFLEHLLFKGTDDAPTRSRSPRRSSRSAAT